MSKRKLEVTLVLTSVKGIIELIDMQDTLTLTGLLLPVSDYGDSLETIGSLESVSDTGLHDAEQFNAVIYAHRFRLSVDGRKHSPSFAGCLLDGIGAIEDIVKEASYHMFLNGCDILCIICNELSFDHIAEFCCCINSTIARLEQDYSRVYISCKCRDHFDLLLDSLQTERSIITHALQYGEEVEDAVTV